MKISSRVTEGSADCTSTAPGSPVSFGWKAAPVCSHESLQAQAMTPAQLKDLTFQEGQTAVVSAASSTSVAASPPRAVARMSGIPAEVNVLSPSTDPDLQQQSKELNAKVSQRKTSRQGRFGQRFVTEDNEHIRLTTGCVPVLKNGKIMLISAAKKPLWILPKGGWEIDEPIEESAIRECYEEAGVTGSLGPRLSDIQYETRKAKKRRLEEKKKQDSDSTVASDEPAEDTEIPAISIPEETIRKLHEPPAHYDESASHASGYSGSHSQARMTLFPLYVTKILDEWPESGRLRQAVDIDEAIRLTEARPEFQQALMELKERKLHLR